MDIIIQLQQNFPTFFVDAIRLALGLVLLLTLFLPLEKLFSLHKQHFFRENFLNDLFYYFLSSLIPNKILIAILSMLALTLHQLNQFQFYVTMTTLPFWERFFSALIISELGFYWGHRWTHEIPYLWRFHRIHHSATQMDWLINTRAHPLDMIFIRLCGYIPVYILGLAQPTNNKIDLLPILITLISNIWGYFIHANLRWRFGLLELCISTPAFHHWHHHNQSDLNSKNYAALFPWVDKFFGTFYLPKIQRPQKYGIDQPVSQNLFKQLIQPFFNR